MRYQDLYQTALIGFALLVTLGSGIFIYRELFPQYKSYQNAYIQLEEFRSSYTHQPRAPFTKGIKQILIANESGAPEVVDRCVSCHVALDLPHFSPTRLARDVNSHLVIDSKGNPVLESNPDYVWAKVDEKIAELTAPSVIEELRQQGRTAKANSRLKKAEKLEKLKTVSLDGCTVEVDKVIRMHPLIGNETRPFEYHPMETYGCTSCHSGNGSALVATRAHGPVFDGEYEPGHAGHKPRFTESDPQNDPLLAKMYNHKPAHELVFQTTPLLAGPLVEARCVECHQPALSEVKSALDKISYLNQQKEQELAALQEGIENERSALKSLLTLYVQIEKGGIEGAISWVEEKLTDFHLTSSQIDAYEGQLTYLKDNEESVVAIEKEIERIVGSEDVASNLLTEARNRDIPQFVDSFLEGYREGSWGNKQEAYRAGKAILNQFESTQKPLSIVTQDKALIQGMGTQIDPMLASYNRGKELFISQACYACHRIAGFSRASVGPELTKAGLSYPWYIKESIVWPQADLPSSTMPNFRLDHEELADLMTFLMAQKGETKAVSEMDHHIKIAEWDKGAKMPWEKAVSPASIQSVREGQLVFASEGCASCHKLEGFESAVGFAGDKEWFYTHFPEQIPGSQLAKRVEEHAAEIDKRLLPNARPKGILEEIENTFPGLIEGFYTNFKFAKRAYNTAYEKEPEKLNAYKERLHRVLMVYIEEYGLGRDIAPHLNWSGVWRDNEWLLGHFHNPTAYTAKSLMPVMPFDDTKFFQLNTMLHALGRKNRDNLRLLWKTSGFNPPLAFELLCASCHGEARQGNGILAEWIFPIPKNLRNPIFLQNLTKERAVYSITHGVKGTPMPPWGEVASPTELGDSQPVLNETEIMQLVDWLYQDIPHPSLFDTEKRNNKWSYQPIDVVDEMEKERAFLQPAPPAEETPEAQVVAYFETRPNPIPGGKELYYIRDAYYTPQNLQEAQELFVVNCAVCHGTEGAGTGLRASTMVEAKPRVFTDIPWIRSEDDLFLLRSIKYGVPGTSMVSWGDQTSAAQRMQLALYIRNLSKAALHRENLLNILYNTFDTAVLTVESARSQEYQKLEEQELKLQNLQSDLYLLTTSTEGTPEKVGALYAEIYQTEKVLAQAKNIDQLYQQLSAALKEEKAIYQAVGEQMIASNCSPALLETYFALIRSEPYSCHLKNGKLTLQEGTTYTLPLIQEIEKTIAAYQVKIDPLLAKTRNPAKDTPLQALLSEQGTYINLKTKLLIQLSDAAALRRKQKSLLLQLPN